METPGKFTARGIAVALASLALALPLAGPARAAGAAPGPRLGPNLVANGGFETGTAPGEYLAIPAGTSPLLANWTVFGSQTSVYGTYWNAEEGARTLALVDSDNTPSGISGVKQTLATKAGQQYRISFYQAGNPFEHGPFTVRCQFGTVTHDYTYQSDEKADRSHMEWIQRSFTFTATSSSTVLSLSAVYSTGNSPLGLDNVQVRAILPPAGPGGTGVPPVASPAALQIKSATLTAGSQQTIAISAAKGVALVLVIDYPDASQLVAPGHAGADGSYSYTWTVPATVHGTVRVLVDAAGSVAQGTFTVG